MPRDPMPNRRAQETFELEHDLHIYSVSFGRRPDGSVGETFIQAHRRGTPVEATARDTAILISFAIQHGLDLSELRKGLTRDSSGAPASIVGAVLDAMAADT